MLPTESQDPIASRDSQSSHSTAAVSHRKRRRARLVCLRCHEKKVSTILYETSHEILTDHVLRSSVTFKLLGEMSLVNVRTVTLPSPTACKHPLYASICRLIHPIDTEPGLDHRDEGLASTVMLPTVIWFLIRQQR